MKTATLFLLLPLVVPLATPMVKLFHKRIGRFVSIPVYLGGIILGLSLAGTVFSENIVLSMGGWNQLFAINLVLSPMSLSGGILLYALALIASLADVHQDRKAYYYLLYSLFLFALLGMLMTADLFNLFVMAEIASIATIALIAVGSKDRGPAGAIRYMVPGALASLLMLSATGLIYSAAGTLNIAALVQVSELGTPFGLLTGIAILGLILFHAELLPFNSWVPGAYTGSSPAFAASLAGMGGLTGILVLARLSFSLLGANSLFAWSSRSLSFIIFIVGIASLLAGEIAALRTKNVFRMLGFSSIGQMGMIAIAIGFGSRLILGAALVLVLAHAIAKSVMLLIAGYMSRMTGSSDRDGLKGAGRRFPVMGALFTILSLSLMGVPLFMGFWGKLGVITELLKTGLRSGTRFWIVPSIIAAVAIVAASVLEGIYLLRVSHGLFEADETPSEKEKVSVSHVLQRLAVLVPAILAGVVIIAVGVYPNLAAPLIDSVADDIYFVEQYLTTILP
jgi:formate hydrogenlyase subunit 3/multisubunit Na+/H+ antiporter MnhD subunit